MTFRWTLPTLVLFSLQAAMAVYAQTAQPNSLEACAAVESDAARLSCYDKIAGHEEAGAEARKPHGKREPHNGGMFPHGRDRYRTMRAASAPGNGDAKPASLLDSRWELAQESKLGTFSIRGYKPVYLLPVFYTSSVNDHPTSPSPDHTVADSLDYQHVQAKFQLSLKTKLWQGLLGDRGDLWFGYTQSSRWQLYNSKISRPFSETDYEPELMMVFDTHYNVLGFDGRLLSLSLNHQSDGRSNPQSRSWNRIIANIGLERGNWTVTLRPWWRIPENASNDDNPDIQDYMGHGEVRIVHESGRNEFSLMARHAFRSHAHGALDFTWSFPIHDNLRGYLDVFNGYGESLLNYNHHSTYVGVGISLLGWY